MMRATDLKPVLGRIRDRERAAMAKRIKRATISARVAWAVALLSIAAFLWLAVRLLSR